MTGSANVANLTSMLDALDKAPADLRFTAPHVLAPALGQVGTESGRFRYTREIWGPTPAQDRYEGSTGLGNTQPGDGYRFRGGGFIQTTGRYNFGKFSQWAASHYANSPDFIAHPEAITTAPWSGVSAVFYWATHGCTGFCDRGDFVGLTRSINGGTNGLKSRYFLASRAGLFLLGRDPRDVRGFQSDAGLTVDGWPGRNTYAAIHSRLVSLPPITFSA